ncbi:glycosyltransferase [Marinobacter sp. MBR-105]|jgi:glycosyltransferase involved in cell wall biosynthesis
MSQPEPLIERLQRLQLFDATWYLEQNEDVRASGLDPWQHYLNHGLAEKRLPGPLRENLGAAGVRVLYALSVQSGGTPQTNEDLMNALAARDDGPVDCFVLRCTGRNLCLYLYYHGVYATIAEHLLAAPIAPFPHSDNEFDTVVGQWLDALGVSLVHVRHSAYQSLGLIEAAYERNVPVVYSFHDYYTACPSVKLLDENRHFCGGRCTATRGECHQELWPNAQVLPLKHESVYAWQGQFSGALALCSGFVATVQAVKNIMLDVFPALAEKPFDVIPHGRDFTEMVQLAQAPVPGESVRVLVPGHIAISKGAEILQHLANRPELAHIEWHVLGTLQQGFGDKMPANVIVHGAYQRKDFFAHVAEIKPHLGAVLSIWPETWCHTLTELWAAGLPVMGFNTGAVGERLKSTGAGWLAEEATAEAMMNTVFRASQPGEWQQALAQVKNWQENGQRSCAQMAEDYWHLYNQVTEAGL